MTLQEQPDHGGGLDAAVAEYGGTRSAWLDLSTGINPCPYPAPAPPHDAWNALPDTGAATALLKTARAHWQVPEGAAMMAAPGASSLIIRLPELIDGKRAFIPGPTYNEHAAAFAQAGWQIVTNGGQHPDAAVFVHPNNPDGRLWGEKALPAPAQCLTVIDESFCDVAPRHSLVKILPRPNTVILKSFGKFWGLAGLRLGFAIGDPLLIARLAQKLGPWPVSGPALHIGRVALEDTAWAEKTRAHLADEAGRLDQLVLAKGARLVGGTSLFRLYDVGDAKAWQHRLAQAHIWSRAFPYSSNWLRLGLPGPKGWTRLQHALEHAP